MAEKKYLATTSGDAVVDRQLVNLPESPGNTVEYHGWAPEACALIGIEVLSVTANTVGNLTLTVTNETTTNTVLSTANISLNATGSGGVLTSDTLYTATLTSTGADLAFAAGGRWKLSLASDNAGMDGAGIYVALTFGGA